MQNKIHLIKNFLLIFIVFICSTINVAWAEIPQWCNEIPNVADYPQCANNSTDVNAMTGKETQYYGGQAFSEDVKRHEAEIKKRKAELEARKTQVLNIVTKIGDVAKGYTDQIANYAERLFWWLVFISFIFQFWWLALKRADFGEFFAKLNRRKLRPSFS